MRVTRSKGRLVLTPSVGEARFLARTFKRLAQHYRLPPSELDADTAGAWYSTQGCRTARMSAEETRDWVRHLHGLKGARVELLERCVQGLEADTDSRPGRLSLTPDEAPEIVSALNDHRLWLAARHGIGEAEMSRRAMEDWLRLNPDQYQALMEIHLLAQLIELLLTYVAPEAADWPSATDWRPGDDAI